MSGRSGETVVDSASNQMRLTRDAHWLWDNFNISVIPTEGASTHGTISWFTQMLVEDEELYSKWHYRGLQPLTGRTPQYLFARSAWDVFAELHAFLQGEQPRRLAVTQPDGKVTVRMNNPQECREFTLGQG